MNKHISVLAKEAIEALQVQPKAWYIDATFGRGGHTHSILEQEGKVVAFDFDQQAITYGLEKFSDQIAGGKLILVHENFAHVDRIINDLQRRNQIGEISGALFDFGTSIEQLTDQQRGLSFAGSAELDMRLDQNLAVKAKDLLAVLTDKQLMQVFSEYGGEHNARSIAKAIVRSRNQGNPVTTTDQLVTIIQKVKGPQRGKIHPATKVFQALRIAVNDELTNIQKSLPLTLEVLEPGARIATIAFHEGEDRIVKQLFRSWEASRKGTQPIKKPIVPTKQEQNRNPRSRSAKLRIFEKKI